MVESERGWGSKIVESKHFDSVQSAKEFAKDFNDDHYSATRLLSTRVRNETTTWGLFKGNEKYSR